MSQAYDYPLSGVSIAQANTSTNNTFQAVVSNHLGTTAPTTTFAGMLWVDITSNWVKVRNAANNGWQELYPLAKRAGIALSSHDWGNISASATNYVFVAPSDATIVRVGILHSGATSSSTDANDIEFMLTNATAANNLFSGVVTTFNSLSGVGGGNELVADTVEWLTANQNQNVTAGAALELVISYNGAMSDTLTRLRTVVEYYVRP